MSKKSSYLRYHLIIKCLKKSPATFKEVYYYLKNEFDLQGHDLTVSKRTFQRDIRDISSLFDIGIEFDKSRKVYHISDGEKPELNNRMLEAFDMFNTLNVANDFSDHILFEKRKAQGTEHFHGILHSIKNKLVIRFIYQKFWEEAPSNREVEPNALKEFKGRWYLLAKERKGGAVKTFGLDRIANLEITKTQFEGNKSFNIEEYYKNSFGIIAPSDIKPQEIVLSFTQVQGKYIKSSPLHHSQRVIEDNKNELRIELFLQITHDFLMELLSFGEDLKVISPVVLKKQLTNSYKNAIENYE